MGFLVNPHSVPEGIQKFNLLKNISLIETFHETVVLDRKIRH